MKRTFVAAVAAGALTVIHPSLARADAGVDSRGSWSFADLWQDLFRRGRPPPPTPRRPPRHVPEFDPGAAGAIATLVAGGAVLVRRRRDER